MIPGWNNFYFLIGSAAASLTGLMFVAISLMSGRDRASALRGIAIYSTPSLVHFAAVFSSSAVTMIPGLTAREAAVAFGVIAVAGLACAARSVVGILRAPAGSGPPHWSDFWLYAGVPAALYAALIASAPGVWADAAWAARAMAGLLLTLLLLGVRNAWDTVTWIAPTRPRVGDAEPAPTPNDGNGVANPPQLSSR